MLPLSALAMDPRAHAHEMLLGFALAVVAGNQLGVASQRRSAALLAAWAAARVALSPRLFGSAKKLRNQALPAVLVSLCAAAAVWHLAGASLQQNAVYATVGLFALLMLFMGGRIIAPAVAGQLYRQGERLDARVQPRLEAALIVAGFTMVGALAAGWTKLAAAAAAVAGALAALRLARWRLWKLGGRADLFCLPAERHQSAALHLITVGALGTLTLNVMAQAWLLKARLDPSRSIGIVAGTVLIALATVLRVFAFFELAAACWTAAFLTLLAIFSRSSAGRI